MLVAAIMTLLVPYAQLNVPDPVAVVVDNFGSTWSWLAKIIKIGAIIGLTSVVLVLMYAQTRIFYTMARDGLLPKVFARVHPRLHTPFINTILVGSITAVAAGFFDINMLGDMTSVGTLAAFAIVSLSVIYLRRSAPELPRGFKVPLYPVVPVLGILSCIYLISTIPWDVLKFFMWYMVGGVVLYFVYGMRHSNLQHGEAQDDQPDLPVYPEDADDAVIRP
jgi:APA family basic amino acid/polyamine antiporter